MVRKRAKQNAKLTHLEKRFHNEFRFEMPKFIIQNDFIHYNQSCLKTVFHQSSNIGIGTLFKSSSGWENQSFHFIKISVEEYFLKCFRLNLIFNSLQIQFR